MEGAIRASWEQNNSIGIGPIFHSGLGELHASCMATSMTAVLLSNSVITN